MNRRLPPPALRAKRLFLVHGPTPIERRPALDEIVGAQRLGQARRRDGRRRGGQQDPQARVPPRRRASRAAPRPSITCGGLQSNHARATALACARLGLRAVLYLRVPDPARAASRSRRRATCCSIASPAPRSASSRRPSTASATRSWSTRGRAAERGVPAYVIPEGGSNGLGSLGYVEAMREVRGQLDLGLCEADRPRVRRRRARVRLGRHRRGRLARRGALRGRARDVGVRGLRRPRVLREDDRAHRRRGARLTTRRLSERSAAAGSSSTIARRAPPTRVMDRRAEALPRATSRARPGSSSIRSTPARRSGASRGRSSAATSRATRTSSSSTRAGLPGLLAQGEELRAALVAR